MSVTEINQVNFDAVIVGSSLTNCITFAALARAGKKVVMFEPQQWHGFTNASLALADFHRLVYNIQNHGDKEEYLYCNVVDERSGKKDPNEPKLPVSLQHILESYSKRVIAQAERLKELEIEYIGKKIEIDEKRKAKEEKAKLKLEAKRAKEALMMNDTKVDKESNGETPQGDDKQENKEKNDEITTEIDPNETNTTTQVQSDDEKEEERYVYDEHVETLKEFNEYNVENEEFLQKLRTKLLTKLPYELLTAQLPPQTLSSPHLCIPFPSYLPTLAKEDNIDVIASFDGGVNDEETSTKIENNEKNDIVPININHKYTSYEYSFPLHNANEYIATSSLPLPNPYAPTTTTADINNKTTSSTPPSSTTTTTNTTTNTNPPQSSEPITSPYTQLIKRNGYRYMVDLAHQEVYASSLSIRSIVEAKIHEYHEFRALNRTLLLFPPDINQNGSVLIGPQNDEKNNMNKNDKNDENDENNKNDQNDNITTKLNLLPQERFKYQSWEIPSSKQEIFGDNRLSLRAKNKLSSLLLILLHDQRNAQCTPWHHMMYHTYKSLPVANLVFHVCNPNYKPDIVQSNPLINSLTNAFSLTTSLTSTLTIAAANSIGIGTNNINNTQQQPNIEPLIHIPIDDFLHDTDACLITQLITAGLSQFLPPVFTNNNNNIQTTTTPTTTIPTTNNSNNNENTLPPNAQLITAIVSAAVTQNLASIGKYSKSAYLYPMYGIGEIAQAWVYNACVWGGLGIIRTALAGMIIPKGIVNEKGQFGVIFDQKKAKIQTNTQAQNCQGNQDQGKGQMITLMLQSGQLITTKALFCDRLLSPFDIDKTTTLNYVGYETTTKSDNANDDGDDKNIAHNNTTTQTTLENVEIKIESKDDNLIQPDRVITADGFNTIPVQQASKITTTQRIVLVVDKLPPHFNQQNLSPEHISIQSFIIPSTSSNNDHGVGKKIDFNAIVKEKMGMIENASSKVFVVDDTVGLSTNRHYMIFITTTLLSTIVNETSNIRDEYQRQVKTTTQFHHEQQEFNSKMTSNVSSESNVSLENNQSLPLEQQMVNVPLILTTLPQLAPFFTPTIKKETTKIKKEVIVTPEDTNVTNTTEPTNSEAVDSVNDQNEIDNQEENEKIETIEQKQDKENEEEQYDIIETESMIIDTNHVHYIASYCYTTITPINTINNSDNNPIIAPIVPATSTVYTATHPLVQNNNENVTSSIQEVNNDTTMVPYYKHIFITPDMDQTLPTVEESFIHASHLYYAYMNYQHNNNNNCNDKSKSSAILSFLMTLKEEIVDDETGEVLQRLEDRNPHLAHTVEVMDDLERELAQIENAKMIAQAANDNNNVDTHVDSTNEATTEVSDNTTESVVVEQDDEAAILAGLDDLDLGELVMDF